MFERFDHTFDIKSVDKEKRLIRGIASLEEIDRDNEIIALDAISSSLQTFLMNPIVRFKHQDPIGRAIVDQTYIDAASKSFIVTAYISDATQTAKEAWGLILDGIIKSFSVGGKVLEKEAVKENGKDFHRITKMELYEISVVDIPSNRKSFFEVIAKSIKENNNNDTFVCPYCNEKFNSEEALNNHKTECPKKEATQVLQKPKDERPPKDWFDRCVAHVRAAGSADDPEAVCGNLWHNIMHEAVENVEKDIDEFTEKRVEQRGNQWCVIHCHGPEEGKPIKCFDTRAEAERMHAAIQANKKSYSTESNVEVGDNIHDSKNKKNEETKCLKKTVKQNLETRLLTKLQKK